MGQRENDLFVAFGIIIVCFTVIYVVIYIVSEELSK